MKILFVCTGNTCRSCMAEAIFNHLCSIDNIVAYSSGVSIVGNSKTSSNTAAVLKEKIGRDISDRFAVQVDINQLKDSDYILAMTNSIKRILVLNFPEYKDRIFTFSEFATTKEDVQDPYGLDINAYYNTYFQLEKGINNILKKL